MVYSSYETCLVRSRCAHLKPIYYDSPFAAYINDLIVQNNAENQGEPALHNVANCDSLTPSYVSDTAQEPLTIT